MSIDPRVAYPVHVYIAHVVFSATLIRNLIGHQVNPVRVSIHKSFDLEPLLKDVLQCEVSPSDTFYGSISYKIDDAKRSFLTESAKLWKSVSE